MGFYVIIRQYDDYADVDPVERRLGPYASQREAEKADAGVNRNLNHNDYYTEVVEHAPNSSPTT